MPKSSSAFTRISKKIARATGEPQAFLTAATIVVVWACTGPLFDFSDTWQLVINTGTTVVTFLMVFLIQHSQNVESQAIQIKLDELIRAIDGAHNALLDLEDLDESELDAIRAGYLGIARDARLELRNGLTDTGVGASPDSK